MVNYVDHISDVQQHLHQCPDPTAIKAFNDVVINICKETRLWKEPLPEISLSEGVNQYLLRLDVDRSSVKIAGVNSVLHGEKDIFATKYEAVQRRQARNCLLYTSPSPRDRQKSRMPSSA